MSLVPTSLKILVFTTCTDQKENYNKLVLEIQWTRIVSVLVDYADSLTFNNKNIVQYIVDYAKASDLRNHRFISYL